MTPDRARLEAIKQKVIPSNAKDAVGMICEDIPWLVERLEEAVEVLKAEAQVMYSGAYHSAKTGEFLSRFEEPK